MYATKGYKLHMINYIYKNMYATKGYKLHMHYIIIQLHSQILIIVVIVAFTCCYDKTI